MSAYPDAAKYTPARSSEVHVAGDIDFTDLDNFADGFPHHLFEIHRREAPVYWHEPTENTPDGEGFWSVATHPETLAVLRDADTYSSVTGGGRPYGGTCCRTCRSPVRCST